MSDDPLGDFPIGWQVSFTSERPSILLNKNLKFSAGQRSFQTPEAANAYKAELQAAGYIASVKPRFRSARDRERAFKRQRQTSFADEWPLQARPPKSK